MKRRKSFDYLPHFAKVAEGYADASRHEFFQDVRIYCKNKQVFTTPLLPLVTNSSWLWDLLKDNEVHTIVEIILPDFNLREVQALFDLLVRGRSQTANPNCELIWKISIVAKAFGFKLCLDHVLQKDSQLIKTNREDKGVKIPYEPLHDVNVYLSQSSQTFVVCRLCRRTFGNFEDINCHLSFDHNQTPKIGINCSILSEANPEIATSQAFHNTNQVQCIFCSEKFQSKEELLRHVGESYYKHGFRKLFGWSNVNFCVICSKEFLSLGDRCNHAIMEHHILDLIHLKHVYDSQYFSDEFKHTKKARVCNKISSEQSVKLERLVRFSNNIQYERDKRCQLTNGCVTNSAAKLKRGIMKTPYSPQPLPASSNTVRAHTILNGITSFFMPDATDLYQEQRSEFDRQIVQRFLDNVNRVWGLDP